MQKTWVIHVGEAGEAVGWLLQRSHDCRPHHYIERARHRMDGAAHCGRQLVHMARRRAPQAPRISVVVHARRPHVAGWRVVSANSKRQQP